MINKEDLRIGNYVSDIHANGMFYGKVIQLTEGKCYYGTLSNTYNDLQHVELTKELLIKLGAIKIESEYPSYNLNGLLINYINGKWIEYVSRIEINGLHHLQNIYYFRINKELTL